MVPPGGGVDAAEHDAGRRRRAEHVRCSRGGRIHGKIGIFFTVKTSNFGGGDYSSAVEFDLSHAQRPQPNVFHAGLTASGRPWYSRRRLGSHPNQQR